MAPPRFVRDTAGIALGQYLSRFVLMLRGIVAARLLGPAAYGSWNALLLVMDYGILSHLGLQQGLDQAIPASLARGDTKETERLKKGGFAGLVVLWLVFVIGVILYLSVRPRRLAMTGWGVAGVLGMAFGVLLQLVIFYHCTLLRSYGRIGAVTKTLSLQAVTSGVAALLLIWPFGMWGLLYGWLIGQVVSLVYARRRGADIAPLSLRLNEGTRRLLAVGIPIFLFTAGGTVLKSLDRILILKYLSVEALGYYSIGLIGVSLLLYLPESVSFVLYPRLIARFGATGSVDATARDLERPLATVSWIMPLLVGVAYFWIEVLVRLFLPQFQPGVSAVLILCFGTLGLAMASLPSYFVLAIGKQIQLVPFAVAAIVLDALLILGFLAANRRIESVALGASIGYAVYGLLLLSYAASHLSVPIGRRIEFVLRAALPSLWGVGLCLLLAGFVRPILETVWPGWLVALVLSIGFAGVYVAAARKIGPRTGLLALLKDSQWPGARLLVGAWTRD